MWVCGGGAGGLTLAVSTVPEATAGRDSRGRGGGGGNFHVLIVKSVRLAHLPGATTIDGIDDRKRNDGEKAGIKRTRHTNPPPSLPPRLGKDGGHPERLHCQIPPLTRPDQLHQEPNARPQPPRVCLE